MKKFLLASVAAGLLATAVPAQAHPGHYAGPGCGFGTLNDTTPGGQLGGQTQWNGEIHALVVATDDSGQVPDSGASITIDCLLYVNGNPQNGGSPVLSASGTGVAAGAADFSFTALDTDVVTLCDVVTVNGVPEPEVCGDATTTQIIPQPVVDIINAVIDLLNNNVFGQIDPTLCPVLGSLAPGISGVLPIDGSGDVYLVGNRPEDLFWDCPPYVES